ncbi:aldehyde dehydrogenase [Agarivorans aestuarii]|uniref:Aldehyde dehydrogenase n=1 Tax=Agarivorans aestuarii TaxID=1563703 RepID=A0ABU7G7F7_9ALTE|nr:aldehyde dehydrogenase [Agarivorans aestuarii]MEE1675114.1 aldehyde dehydrogenase [Agarivorans aestuarii]
MDSSGGNMAQHDLAYWQQQAGELTFPTKAFINGAFVDAQSGQTFSCINPATGQVLAEVAECDAADVELAVTAARAAYQSGVWSNLPPAERKQVLQAFAQLVDQHQSQLALLESLDMGKPIGDALSYDAPATARCIAWNGEAIDKVYDEVAPVTSDALALVTREALGVVAAIVPWNFPLVMASWKIGPALATGNSVILKPSEKSPLSALYLAQLAKQAGIPDGVFNVLPGYGHTAGQALALHMDVDCITFTGSTAVGKKLVEFSGQSNLKRAFMECGGKSPNLVCADVADLDKAAGTALAAIFYNQGEVCTAGSRLIVHRSVHKALVDKMLALVDDWQPGNPLDPNTSMGAMVDEVQMQRVLAFIDQAKAQGAKLLCGGEQALQGSGGYFLKPTIFDDVDAKLDIVKQEIFGPVLVIQVFDELEQGIALANDTEYGLAAGVWTSDINTAVRTSRALRAGTVFVNNWDGGDMTMPFGGFKQSGNGRDKSLHALEKYTELKSTWIDLT